MAISSGAIVVDIGDVYYLSMHCFVVEIYFMEVV